MTLPHRISIVGPPGSGKTTLASDLAGLLGITHIELDAIKWGPNWAEASSEALLAGAIEAMRVDGWVVDGNYGDIRGEVWAQADTVIWLNYPVPLIQVRLFKRTVRRMIRKEVLWNDNVEDWKEHFLSRETLFLYSLKATYRLPRIYPMFFKAPEFSHLDTFEMKSTGQTRNWLARLRHQLSSQ
jgi:energy-coupling factor transporter ATP-binding protein EcfA2